MDRFPNYSRQPSGPSMVPRPARSSRGNIGYQESDAHDDHGSVSGSDDGTYAAFTGSTKREVDRDNGADLVLTSQTLNADGTPKRPMNAFMIFARRRRPQVSSENQSMRTGEISKLLSKEWSTMAAVDKQFYQDQAKLLKETFNTKYPDYVYRRRPNNSRRRRRSDAMRPEGLSGDLNEDGGSLDFESPTECDDHLDRSDYSYSRGPSEPCSHNSSASRYANPSISRTSGGSSFHSNSHHLYRGNESHSPYPSSSERHGYGLSHRQSNPSLNYPLSSSVSSSSYPPSDLGSSPTWNPRPDRGSAAWSANSDRGLPSLKAGNYPGSSGSGWSSAGLSPSSSTNSHYSNSTSSAAFPTLNSSYYPSNTEYSPISPPVSAHLDSSLALHPIDRPSYELRGSGHVGGDPLTYPSSRGLSRVLPPVASLSGYPSHLQSTSSSMTAPTSYWAR